MGHIRLGCQKVREFWGKILEIYQKVSGTIVTPNIKTSLFSPTPDSKKETSKGILHLMTSAERTIITRKWKEEKGPTIAEWICEMREIHYMEKQRREEGNVINTLTEIWQKWDEFRLSKEMKNFI